MLKTNCLNVPKSKCNLISRCCKVKVKSHTSQGDPHVLLLPLDGMLKHRRVYLQQYVAGAHLYTGMERDNVGKVSRLGKQHNGRN